jgi:N6-L-threonylcarbamoyladenine synthase
MNETEVNHHFTDLSASYQWAAVQQLVRKTSHAWNQGQFKSLGLSGGVANNKVLRSQMKDLADHSGALLLCAEPKYTGDNASMIAYASHVDPHSTWSNENQELSFNASLKLEHLPS